MTEATSALMGISADDHDSFFLQVESHFIAILKMLHVAPQPSRK
jgi:hypothetical protein